MITVVSLSPSIDKKLELDHFSLYRTNRVRSSCEEAAGKGIIVSLAAQAMGLPVRCVGILPEMHPLFLERLNRNGVLFDFLPAPGAVRTNLKLFDRTTRQITEVNEPCPTAPRAFVAEVTEHVLAYAKKSKYLVLTGSLPDGFDAGWYAEMIRTLRDAAPDCRCILDADGERLRLGVCARPWMIKPNLEEIEQMTGECFHEEGCLAFDRLLSSARSIVHSGIENVVVSLGAEGAIAVTAKEAYFSPAPPIDIQTTTGAGDAMVAGFLYGFMKHNMVSSALRCAVASAASRCHTGGDACINFEYMESMCAGITIANIA